MKTYIIFSVPIKEEHDNGKTITYKVKFNDSCRFMQSKNYQTLLITYLKLIIRIAKHAWGGKISNQNVSLSDLEIIDWITDARNAREHLPTQ